MSIGSGWPSFSEVAKKGTVTKILDESMGMSRIEVVCTKVSYGQGEVFLSRSKGGGGGVGVGGGGGGRMGSWVHKLLEQYYCTSVSGPPAYRDHCNLVLEQLEQYYATST